MSPTVQNATQLAMERGWRSLADHFIKDSSISGFILGFPYLGKLPKTMDIAENRSCLEVEYKYFVISSLHARIQHFENPY